MSRWHEAGCKKPTITVLDNAPCCTHCFAFASVAPNAANIVPAAFASDALSDQEQNDRRSSHLESGSSPLHDNNIPFTKIKCEEQFRLLRISAGKQSGPVHVSVEAISIRDPLQPSYDILSYARFRGSIDQIEWRPIYVGQYWDMVFVPSEYEGLLQAVRHRETHRSIWMECLCIDETDVKERTCQIALVSQILRGATKTLMCLGSESTEKYSEAIAFLASFESFIFSPLSTELTPSRPLKTLKSLKHLLQHEYFATVQVVREVVLGRNLTMLCNGKTIPWTDQLSEYIISRSSAPRWLRGPKFRYNHAAKDTLRHLLETTSYHCRDDRDRVFVLLALFHMDDVVIDYEMSIENVFIGVTRYLIRNGLLWETISIATTQRKRYDLPSWVPDWGTAISMSLGSLFGDAGGLHNMTENEDIWDESIPIEFSTRTELHLDAFSDAEIGHLTISEASRLCAVQGTIVKQNANCTEIRIDRGVVGTLLVTCPIGGYRPGFDFIFLIPCSKQPVILRHNSARNSYALICVCSIGRGPPIGTDEHFIPWRDPTFEVQIIKVFETPQEVLELMQNFCSDLMRLHRAQPNISGQQELSVTMPVPFSQAETLVLDIALLSLASVREVESTLRERWMQLYQQLDWMFRDRQALSSFLREIDLGSHTPSSGSDALPFSMDGTIDYFRACGVNLPVTSNWDLRTFVRSHMSPTATAPSSNSVEAQGPNTMLLLLRSKHSEIRTWAITSAQLLLLFECSGSLLEESWPGFPGLQLTERWRRINQNFDDGMNPQREPGRHWDWSEFRAVLQLRSAIWAHPVPPKLRVTGNVDLATRLSLRCLGLHLNRWEKIEVE